jgi:hypothetical protein
MLASAVTTGTIMTITAVAAHGMDVRRIGPSRAVSVSPIAMVHGTTDTDGIVKHMDFGPDRSCGRGYFTRTRSGSLAKFAAIRRAPSRDGACGGVF